MLLFTSWDGHSAGGWAVSALAVKIGAIYPNVTVKITTTTTGEPAALIEPLHGPAATLPAWENKEIMSLGLFSLRGTCWMVPANVPLVHIRCTMPLHRHFLEDTFSRTQSTRALNSLFSVNQWTRATEWCIFLQVLAVAHASALMFSTTFQAFRMRDFSSKTTRPRENGISY